MITFLMLCCLCSYVERTARAMKWCGLCALIVYWLLTILSICANPWFSVMHNALSDLGSNSANSPWLYNLALILGFPFLLAFSLHVIHSADNKLKTVGGAFILISSIFMGLIGVFHSGTRPHIFVSTYFFLQFFSGMLIWGLGSRERIVPTALFAFAIVGIFVPWPSTALIEIYEIGIIASFVIWYPLTQGRSRNKGNSLQN